MADVNRTGTLPKTRGTSSLKEAIARRDKQAYKRV